MSKTGGEKTSKAAFVRAIDDSVPAKEVVAKAKAAGITITEKHVYVIRSGARKKKAGAKSAAPKPTRVASPGASHSSDETSFRKLALAIGIPRAKAIVADLERRLEEIIHGR